MPQQVGTIAAPATAVAARIYTPGTTVEIADADSVVASLGGIFYTIIFDPVVPEGPYRMHLLNVGGTHLVAFDVVFDADSWVVAKDGVSLEELEAEFGPGPWGQGTGPNIVNVTVNHSGGGPFLGAVVLIQGAGVTLVWGVASAGTVQFKMPNGNYTATVQSTVGYEPHTPVAFTVAGATVAVTLTMAPQAVAPPAAPGTRNGYWVCRGPNGAAVPGEVVNRQFLEPPVGGIGNIYDKQTYQATADGSGIVRFTDLVQGAVYGFWVGSGPVWQVKIPTGSTEIAIQDITGVFDA